MEFVRYDTLIVLIAPIEMETPVPSPPISRGAAASRPILGGLHHV
jgi:hypothetical protein